MIELTVKTLDSKNHAFSVPDDITVKQLKDRIAEKITIPTESQRLIYCGRVLQDEKNLSEYDVNGKVIHLVQRAPPGANGNASSAARDRATTGGTSGARRNQQWRNWFGQGANSSNAMYLGAMAFPAEIVDLSAMRQPRQCLSQSRLDVVRAMLQRASTVLNRLENPSQDPAPDAPAENGSEPGPANTDEANTSDTTPLLPAEVLPRAFIINGQQIDAVEVETSDAPSNNTSEPSSASSEGEPQASGGTGSQQTPEGGSAEEGSQYPRTTALADLLDQAAEINTRVQPFMSQYQQLMRDDPSFTDQVAVTTNQRLFSHVSEIMHNLAHAYHALSDIMCDFSQPPPRILRCRPVLIQHSAVVQTGIPMQVPTVSSDNEGQQNSGSGSSTDSQARNTSNGAAPATAPDAGTPAAAEGAAPAEPAPARELSWAEQMAAQDPAGPNRREPATGSARPQPIRFTRVDSVGPPGLEVFVDVGPGSITIDSVETTVLANASGNSSSDQNTWQNPPEFVQSLLTAVAGQLMGSGLPPGVAVSLSSEPPQPPAQGSQGTSSSPTQPAAPAPAQAAQNSQARGNTATHPTTATQTRSTPRPHVHLSPSINGLRANTFDPFLPCNSHHIRSGRAARAQRAGQTQPNSGANTAEPLMNLPPPSSISISVRAGRDSMNNYIPNVLRPGTAATRTRMAETPLREVLREASQRNAEVPSPLQIFRQLQTISTAHRVEGGTAATVAQVLENVSGYSYTPGESILTDIFMTLAQSLSFTDLVQLGLGSSECLERARPPLQQLISQRLLNNQPLTRPGPATTSVIDELNAELAQHYSIFEAARLREDVDLPASINAFNHAFLPSILHTIMDEDQATFHRYLLEKSVVYIRQLCALIQSCCLDGVNSLESILRAVVVQMTNGVPGALQEWTMSHSISNFRSFISSVNNHLEEIKRYLVHKDPPGSSQQPSTVSPVTEPMDTDLRELAEVASNFGSDIALPTAHNNDAIGWQNTLPSDWVPIITRDSQRQRRQNSQGPFSDAYMSGMPSKRRKLYTSAKPQGNLSQVITESMATALGAAGMSSGPEVDVIAQRAGQDTLLRTAYREQIRSTLHYNLNTNPDYLPDKYPNTSKYLKK